MRTKHRVSQLIIDTPKPDSDAMFNLSLQKLDLADDDDTIITEYPRTEFIHKLASNVSYEGVTVYDPILRKEVTISIAGIQTAIEYFICDWIVEKHPEYVIKDGHVWEL
jgi:hypothetical protein